MEEHSPPPLAKTRFGLGIISLAAVSLMAWLSIWAFVIPLVLGWSPVAIYSGSMGPGIDPGDIVVARPHDGKGLGRGSVIVFEDPVSDGLVTHRIVAFSQAGDYVTKGDANRRIDSTPVRATAIVGVGRILVPFVGKPYVWVLKQQWVSLLVGATVLAVLSWTTRWGLLDRFDPWLVVADGPVSPSEGLSIRARSAAWLVAALVAGFLLMATIIWGIGSEAVFSDSSEASGSSFTADTLQPATTLTSVGGTSISLSWTATPDTYASGHRVLRSTTPGGPYSQIAEVTPRATTSFVDSPPPGTYYYVVRAFYLSWESTNSNQTTAVAVSPEAFIALDGGLGHTCGSRVDGSVWCWGRNDKGQVGNGLTGDDQDVPVRVAGAGGVGLFVDAAEVVAGTNHGCSVKTTGTLWCWGLNSDGQLGNNTTTDSNYPIQVVGTGGTGFLTGAANAAAGETHSCVIKTNGTVWCWGRNGKGQLGNNTTINSNTPVQVVGAGGVGVLTNAVKISAGLKQTCVTKTDGTVWCWGLNDEGQLGNNTTTDSNYPVQVIGAGGVGLLANAADVAAGESHSCATKTDGTAWCWGRNDKGQLGNNTTTNSLYPVQVVGAGGVGLLANAAEIVAGLKHTCVTKTDGTVWCWGLNDKGQLGNNTTTNSNYPVQVVGPGGTGLLANIAVTGTGDTHSCAARTDNTVWCWGNNPDGQLGNNTTTNSNKPVQARGV